MSVIFFFFFLFLGSDEFCGFQTKMFVCVTDKAEASRLPAYGQRESSAGCSLSPSHLPAHQKETPVRRHIRPHPSIMSIPHKQQCYTCIPSVSPAGWTRRSGWRQWRCCCLRAVKRASGWCSTWSDRRDERSPGQCLLHMYSVFLITYCMWYILCQHKKGASRIGHAN